MSSSLSAGLMIRGPAVPRSKEVLTPDALDFVAQLHRESEPRRQALLQRRQEVRAQLAAGATPGFPAETQSIREGNWQCRPAPDDLRDRKVEITGPTDRKMIINALNSGASTYMADFEDANTPSWANMVSGQANLVDAIERRIDFRNESGKLYRLNEQIATLIVRPRGWHLVERHAWVDGQPVAGAVWDFGLFAFHNARRLLARGSGPYLYLAKLEDHAEARLWNDVFDFTEATLAIPHGSIRATVLIETCLAALQMEEILYELRDHCVGLNAGRWDYIFSFIKKFGDRPGFQFPDRAQVTMTVPFMRAYAQQLTKVCHRRGAHAIGGMAAFIPSRRDPGINAVALAKVREDKVREAGDGMDGTWVAHPDLVPVAREEFDRVLGDRPNQVERQRPDVGVTAADLLDVSVPGGTVTEAGLRNNVDVAVRYLESWLRGVGAAGIYNLMEDAATAEIARSQVWQWVHHGTRLQQGPVVTADLVRQIVAEVAAEPRFAQARALFEHVALSREFVEFLTVPGYDLID